MKVLVTGADGYIGAVLTPYLMKRGYDVVGLDAGFYRGGWLFDDLEDRPRVITRDIRRVTPKDLEGFDAVVHLAELSNDPLGAHNPEITYDINFRGSMNVAQSAKKAGVPRFVYASSCSVYGAGNDDIKTEESAPNPQTAYAECKVRCEQGLAELVEDSFVTTCLRNATAFGASPRMRFDIVLNNLSGLAWTTGKIAMTSDGKPWRPLVHVLDICQAIECTLRAPKEDVKGQIFNVGDERQNYRVSEIAEMVAAAFPGCTISFGAPGPDNRSYRVDFSKIRKHLPDFRCQWSAERGAAQLYQVFSRIGMTREMFEAPAFTRLNALKLLVGSGQLDPLFHWLDMPETPAAAASRQAAE
ncbi:SDR family oxidoreductase [Aerophototrophica crusticola]|uniref:SDR family oxidoreductase n=1 Tax=Aerophototrophica crusticola TaxID=1709002 RepID=A0A858R8Q0_9PROT|nr:SDR family oxidoreductase [Rhodospirillaceae bacterium B3]